MDNDDIYRKNEWTRTSPGLLIILIDQSEGMALSYDADLSRTQFTAKAVNRVINTLIQKNFDGREPLNCCYIEVIGYNSTTTKILSGTLKDLEAYPIRLNHVLKEVPDGNGGFVKVRCIEPIWIDSKTQNCQMIDMEGAFYMAKDAVKTWIYQNPNSPVPVIINIVSSSICYNEAKNMPYNINEIRRIVKTIRNIDAKAGKTLLFNLLFAKGDSCVYPSSNKGLANVEKKFMISLRHFLIGLSIIIMFLDMKLVTYLWDLEHFYVMQILST